MVSPSRRKPTAGGAASAAGKKPAAAAGDAKPPPEADDADATKERQLAEFNQWLFRWNNYQQHLAHYWQGRYHALYQQMGGAPPGVAGGGGKVKKGKKGSKSGLSVTDKVELKWNMRFQELVEFKEEHGHTNVPKEYTYKFSPPLGHWVGRMRHLYKKGTLEQSRLQRLEDIGFEWILSKTDSVKFSVVWDTSFQALKAFRDLNGHVEVPKGYKPKPDMTELDGWITRQRKHFKDGKLPDHLKDKLLDLGINLGGRGRPFGIETEEAWNMNYSALVQYYNDNGDCDVPEKYSGDKELCAWVKLQRDAFSDRIMPNSRVNLLNRIGFNFYHGKKSAKAKSTDPWQRRFTELQAYKEKAGDCNVPKKFTLNFGLGDFVYNQRMAYKEKKLSDEKVKALEDLGFEWSLKARPAKKKNKTNWEKRFEELEEYKAQYGDLNIPADYEANPLLAGWLKRQKKYQREGVMKPAKYEKLKALGFNFGGAKQTKKPWMEHYESLVEFRNEHGHNDVPVHYEANPQLYYWIGTQKQSFKKGKLSEDRMALMNEIDFDFAIKPRDRTKKHTRGGNKPFLDEDEWEKLFGELEMWKEKHGDCDVPQRNGRLGSWVHYMRFYVKSGKLTQDRVDRLNEIGFCWNVTDNRWMQKFEQLKAFKADYGNFDVPGSNPLYNWTSYQKQLYHKDSLPQDRVDLLNSIQFDFDSATTPRRSRRSLESPEAWEKRFQDLVAFKSEHGHCKVPPTYDPNPALAKWAATQRTKYSKGSLKDDKLDRLNEVGFEFGSQPTLGPLKVPKLEPVDRETYLREAWDKSYEELAAYKNHFGHCNIPINYDANPGLGAWAFSQKMAFKKDKLSQDRIDKLNELGFSFGPQKKAVTQIEV